MDRLFARWARRCDARWWTGERPEGRIGQLPRLIAGRVGYPTAAADPFAAGGLVPLDRAQAAHVLAVVGTTSLPYGDRRPRTSALREAVDALGWLTDDAVFIGNGLWPTGDAFGWQSMTAATFDGGVIGWDAARAFIFWVEEED